MPIKSFRGKLLSDGIEKVTLHTNTGSTGYRIKKFQIMPVNPDVDLKAIELIAKEKIATFAGEGETRTSIDPVAFGLNSLSITFVMEESIGSPDVVADQINEIEGVNSVETTDVRRALG